MLDALRAAGMTDGNGTLRDEMAAARGRFVRAGIPVDEAVADAERLARHTLRWDRATWLARNREVAPAGFAARYAPLVARRAQREPVSLILGEREFWGLRFAVGPAVLTPRPETELIVEAALGTCADWRDAPIAIADVGTGSGCLAVALAREFPRAVVTAVDRSADALNVARRNAAAHGVAERIAWVCGRFEEWMVASGDVRYDLVVANLPYVPTGDLQSLPQEIRDHEPRLALDGGFDGLDPLRALLRLAAQPPCPTWLIVELGAGQAVQLGTLLEGVNGLVLLDLRADLQGIPRVAVIRPAAA